MTMAAAIVLCIARGPMWEPNRAAHLQVVNGKARATTIRRGMRPAVRKNVFGKVDGMKSVSKLCSAAIARHQRFGLNSPSL